MTSEAIAVKTIENGPGPKRSKYAAKKVRERIEAMMREVMEYCDQDLVHTLWTFISVLMGIKDVDDADEAALLATTISEMQQTHKTVCLLYGKTLEPYTPYDEEEYV